MQIQNLVWDGAENTLDEWRISGAREISVLWWNLERGDTNARLGNDPLGQNLKHLISQRCPPDLLIFGEYNPTALSAETEALIRQQYLSHFLPCNVDRPQDGIVVFYRRNLQSEPPATRPLPWGSEELRQDWLIGYPDSVYFCRNYRTIRFRTAHWSLVLVPLHLVQPWDRMTRAFAGKFRVFVELFWGRNNPLYTQIERLREELRADFGPHLERANLLLVGDLNTPKLSIGVRRVGQDLREVMTGWRPTFPASGTPIKAKYPKLPIDHAFVSPSIEVLASDVLTILGSDHYPIRFHLRLPPAP